MLLSVAQYIHSFAGWVNNWFFVFNQLDVDLLFRLSCVPFAFFRLLPRNFHWDYVAIGWNKTAILFMVISNKTSSQISRSIATVECIWCRGHMCREGICWFFLQDNACYIDASVCIGFKWPTWSIHGEMYVFVFVELTAEKMNEKNKKRKRRKTNDFIKTFVIWTFFFAFIPINNLRNAGNIVRVWFIRLVFTVKRLSTTDIRQILRCNRFFSLSFYVRSGFYVYVSMPSICALFSVETIKATPP